MQTNRVRAVRVAIVVALLGAVALSGCSKDKSDDADKGTTPSSTAVARSTSTTVGSSTSTTTEPRITTTIVKPTGGPTSFRGVVDGQPKVVVTFTKGATLTDLKANDLEIECQPLDNGDAKTTKVDVAIPSAPVASNGSVTFTQSAKEYQPTISGSFTKDGRFAGALSLSGQKNGYACGGEFTFIAVHG